MTMTAERWARIDELFHQALALDSSERDDLFAAACADDDDLRSSVEALLRAHDTEAPVLDGGPELLVAVLDADIEPATNRHVGPYRIVRELGRGGMGVVYLAERDDADFRHVVALKCLLPGVATPDLVERFRRERRILAGLVHPGIAQLHDGGLTESGEPYLVMEYIEGEPIDRYCDRRRFTVEERLRLFATVCAAVQYAHEHLVVHRDLKPGNVLVTESGGVKLLDFGIAKLLDDATAGDAPVTVTERLLTPNYASPEQVRGEPVTTASDVFSLGLILFHLLTGRRAFTPAPGPFGPLRAVVDTEAAHASVSVQEAADDVANTPGGTDGSSMRAAARASTPARLHRRLRGDLDTILDRALRKEPSERYASAQALLDDVRRHLDGLPIHARPAGRLYRAGKFIRRYRTGVAASVVVLLALVVGLLASVWQGRIAARERDLARMEALKAQRVTDFLIDVFASADPNEAPGENLTAREILDRGARMIDAQLAAEPAIQATVQRAIGSIYRNLAEFEPAKRLLERSLEQHRRELGPDHPEVADDLFALAVLAWLSREPGRRADSLHRLALGIRRRTLRPDDPRIGSSLLSIGLAMVSSDTLAADTLTRQALAIFERDPASKAALGEALNNLGFLNHQQGNYAQAERHYREALRVKLEAVGEDHPTTLITMSNLGWILQLMGSLDAADSVLRRTLAARRRILGARHILVAGTLSGLGEVAHRRAAYEEAERYFTEALEIRQERLPPSAAIADNIQMLANVAAARGRYAEAQSRYREAIELLERGGLGEGMSMARTLSNRGGLYVVRGDFAGAVASYRRAWQLYRKRAGDAHAFTAIVQGNLGSALLQQDSLTSAEPLLRSAAEVLRKAYSEDHTSVGIVLIDLGSLELKKGERAAAEQTLRRAVEILEAGFPAGHWRIAQAKLRLGRCLHSLGRDAEAEVLLQSALTVLEPLGMTRMRDRREALLGLEEVAMALGRDADARRYRTQRLALRP